MYDKATMLIRQKALETGVSVSQLTGRRRTKTIAKAKRELRKQLRNETDLSWTEINELLGYAFNYHR